MSRSTLFTLTTLLTLLGAMVSSAPLDGVDNRSADDVYDIGVGIGDCTGPAAEVNMMGYAMVAQTASGIHLRQFSRAFIIGDGVTRVVIVSVDAGMVTTAVTIGVIAELKKLYGDLYTERNVLMSGTHTHSGPAGFFQYFMYDVTSLGFINETYNALVNGIVKSISNAHSSIRLGRIYHSQGELTDASINRSPSAYQNNPDQEKAKYQYDTDKKMLLLKLVDTNEQPIGMINWFSVHGTSMNNTNGYISSDNKGYASLMFEEQMNPPGTFPGQGAYVAAFAQSNEGDASPNTAGAKCIDTGLPCDYYTSTCNGRTENCIAFGPGNDMFESTKIIATKQFDMANSLYLSAVTPLHGPVSFIHQHINMTKRTFEYEGRNLTTCGGAMGFSFAGGTTDGPGALDFHQGITQGHQNDLWDMVRNLLHTPSQELLDCHVPKAVLFPTGEMSKPTQWTPEIIPTQLFRLGNLVVIGVPGEFTTMSGRRTRDAVQQKIEEMGGNPSGDLLVTIAGLSNIYTNYITTYEEYQVQRYEGGSTLFGPNTLNAYISQFQYLAAEMTLGNSVEPGPDPPNLLDEQICLLGDVLFETTPPGKWFGDVLADVQPIYAIGDTVQVSFVCGNPRNNILTGSTFLTVEHQNPSTGDWLVVAVDSHWETKFGWRLSNSVLQQSTCTIEWDIPVTAAVGNYRIWHQGYYKLLWFTDPIYYNGTSSTFKVNSPARQPVARHSFWEHLNML